MSKRSIVVMILSLTSLPLLVNLLSNWLYEHLGLETRTEVLIVASALLMFVVTIVLIDLGLKLPGRFLFHRVRYLTFLARSDRLRRWSARFAPLHLGRGPRYVSGTEVQLETGERRELVDLLAGLVATEPHSARRILVLGEPGCGKSTALERLVLRLAADAIPRLGFRAPFPVLLRASDYQPGDDLRGLLRKGIHNWTRGGTQSVLTETKPLQRLLDSAQLVILVDALDEVSGERREELLKILAQPAMIGGFERVSVIATCRTRQDPQRALPDYDTYTILPLSEESILAFIRTYSTELDVDPGSVLRRLRVAGFLRPGELGRNPFWLRELIQIGVNITTRSGILTNAARQALSGEYAKPMTLERSWIRDLGLSEQQFCDLCLQTLVWAAGEMKLVPKLSSPIIQKGLWDWLQERFRKYGAPVPQPEQILEVARDAGILDMSHDPIAFSHRIVQEYFTACWMATDTQAVENGLQRFVDELDWWQTLALHAGLLPPEQRDELVARILSGEYGGSSLACAIATYLGDNVIPATPLASDLLEALRAEVRGGDVLDAELRRSLKQFLEIGHDNAARFLGNLAGDPAPKVRGRLYDILSLSEAPEAVRLLTYVGLDDAEDEAADIAIDSLVTIGDPAIWTLIRQIHNPNTRAQGRAIRTLGRMRTPAAVNYLFEISGDENLIADALAFCGAKRIGRLLIALATGTEEQRCLAARALGQNNDPRSPEALIRTVADPSIAKGVREAALEGLKGLDKLPRANTVDAFTGSYVVRALIAACKTKDRRVSSEALGVLASHGDKEAMRYLLQRSRTPENPAYEYLESEETLPYVGSRQIIESLIEFSADPAPEVRAASVRCIFHNIVEQPAGRSAIRTNDDLASGLQRVVLGALQDEKVIVRESAAAALERIAGIKRPVVPTANVCVPVHIDAPSALRHLQALASDSEPEVRKAAFRSLLSLSKFVSEDTVLRGLQDPDAGVRREMWDQLADIDKEQLQSMNTGRLMGVVLAAVRLAGGAFRSQATETLLRVGALSDPEDVRSILDAGGLASFYGQVLKACATGNKALHSIPAAALHDPNVDSDTAVLAAKALGAAESPESLNALRGAIHHTDGPVRAAAIRALTVRNSVLPSVSIRVALEDEHPEVREAAVEAMSESGAVEFREEIIGMIDYGDSEFRQAVLAKADSLKLDAASVLRIMGPPQEEKAIAERRRYEMIHWDGVAPSLEPTQNTAVAVLNRMANPAATEALAQIALEREGSLREEAVTTLGSRRDPRAVYALFNVIRGLCPDSRRLTRAEPLGKSVRTLIAEKPQPRSHTDAVDLFSTHRSTLRRQGRSRDKFLTTVLKAVVDWCRAFGVAPLLKALEDPNHHLRETALLCLAALEAREFRAAVLAAASDPAWQVRYTLFAVLNLKPKLFDSHGPDSEATDDQLVELIVAGLSDPHGSSEARFPSALDLLDLEPEFPLISDTDRPVAQQAAEALGKQDGDAVLRVLRAVQDDSSGLARRAIVEFAKTWEHPGALALLRQATADPRSNIRWIALRALRHELLEETMGLFVHALDDEAPGIVSTAAEHIARFPSHESFGVLAERILDVLRLPEGDPTQVGIAILHGAISGRGTSLEKGPEIAAWLLKASLHRADELREDAAQALRDTPLQWITVALTRFPIEPGVALPGVFLELAARSADPILLTWVGSALDTIGEEHLCKAARAAGVSGTPYAIPFLLHIVGKPDTDPETRAEAENALAQMGPESWHLLKQVLQDKEASHHVIAAVIGALGISGDKSVSPELLRGLAHRDREVQIQSAKALEQLGDVIARELALQAGSPSPYVQNYAMVLLSVMRGQALPDSSELARPGKAPFGKADSLDAPGGDDGQIFESCDLVDSADGEPALADEDDLPLSPTEDEKQMTFLEHLEELRDRLLRVGVVALVAGVCSFELYPWLSRLFFNSLCGWPNDPTFLRLSLGLDAENLAICVAAWASFPVLLYQTSAFIGPGLRSQGKNLGSPIAVALAASVLLAPAIAVALARAVSVLVRVTPLDVSWATAQWMVARTTVGLIVALAWAFGFRRIREWLKRLSQAEYVLALARQSSTSTLAWIIELTRSLLPIMVALFTVMLAMLPVLCTASFLLCIELLFLVGTNGSYVLFKEGLLKEGLLNKRALQPLILNPENRCQKGLFVRGMFMIPVSVYGSMVWVTAIILFIAFKPALAETLTTWYCSDSASTEFYTLGRFSIEPWLFVHAAWMTSVVVGIGQAVYSTRHCRFLGIWGYWLGRLMAVILFALPVLMAPQIRRILLKVAVPDPNSFWLEWLPVHIGMALALMTWVTLVLVCAKGSLFPNLPVQVCLVAVTICALLALLPTTLYSGYFPGFFVISFSSALPILAILLLLGPSKALEALRTARDSWKKVLSQILDDE